ncbi:hypothetical protein G9A89_020133 [Geosiphon pyriformis]|nr:hypothetical protein G9A89_020133 [Geosiphon pyriformis]
MVDLHQNDELVNYNNDKVYKVSKNFYNRWLSCEAEALRILRPYVYVRDYQDFGFIFTGHGEGGVFALFAALAFARLYRRRILAVTFGMPRIGNYAFSRLVEIEIYHWRVTHSDDYVPLFFGEKFWHQRVEYWIPGDRDCNCDSENDIPLYRCENLWLVFENPHCNQLYMPPKPLLPFPHTTAHDGPYFGQLMGECVCKLKIERAGTNFVARDPLFTLQERHGEKFTSRKSEVRREKWGVYLWDFEPNKRY